MNRLLLATATAAAVAVGWWLSEDRPTASDSAAPSPVPVSARPAPATQPPPAPAATIHTPGSTNAQSDAEPGLVAPTRDATGTPLNPAVSPPPTTVKLGAGVEPPGPKTESPSSISSPAGQDRSGGSDDDDPAVPNLPAVTQIENQRTAFRHYAARFGGNPVGNNEEITAALRGQNARGAVFLSSADGLRVNADGQTIDTWGTPYFFHQLSRTETEIRSAGPDRRMWTSDDLVMK